MESFTHLTKPKIAKVLMAISGVMGLTLFIYANIEPEDGYWFGVMQLLVNSFVFVTWFSGFLVAVTLPGRLFALVGALIPLLMAMTTLERVLL